MGCPDCKRRASVLQRIAYFLRSLGEGQKVHARDVEFALKDIDHGLHAGPKPPPVHTLRGPTDTGRVPVHKLGEKLHPMSQCQSRLFLPCPACDIRGTVWEKPDSSTKK